MKIKIAVCCLVLWLPWRLHAQDGQAAVDSIRVFVQAFYDWYTPQSLNRTSEPAWDFAIETRGSAFSPRLVRSIRDDSAAQAKAQGEIVGLDFDPFLGGQDPGRHYKVGRITQRGSSYWVEVQRVSEGKTKLQPSVVAEVSGSRGAWCFINFHYPHGRDLLNILEELKLSRAGPPPPG